MKVYKAGTTYRNPTVGVTALLCFSQFGETFPHSYSKEVNVLAEE